MEILIIVLITTVVFGLCFRFAPQVGNAKRVKQMHDHEERMKGLLEISQKNQQARTEEKADLEANQAGKSSASR